MRTAAAALLVVAVVGGCASDEVRGELSWFTTQAVGQAELLFAGRAVSSVLRDEDTDPRVARRLRLVEAARDFARDELSLTVRGQYERVVFLGGAAVVYVVSAAEATSLDPVTWSYPVVGDLPYRGYFRLEEAEREAARLADTGLDVDVRPVRTYSLLGLLPDPLVSSMLFASDETRLVETVIHELAHATVFASGQGAFNEGLATFIGVEGARRFIARSYGEDSAVAARFEGIEKDHELYARAVGALAFDLRVLFVQARALPPAEVLARKDQIFLTHQRHFDEEVRETLATFVYRGARLPNNNAELAAFSIYSLKQALYERAYASCGREMRCFLRLLRDVAAADDPETELAQRVDAALPPERVLR